MSVPQPAASRHSFRFGIFELDANSGELRKSGLRIKLEPQPLQLLKLLLERQGTVVTREELKQALWPADTFVDFEHSINAAVKRLRQALNDSAEAPRFIETAPRRGYRFIYPLNPEATPGVPPKTIVDAPYSARVSRVAKVSAAATALSLIATVALYVWRPPHKTPTIASVAVLPLANVSGDTSEDYFADGMTDGVITDIAQIPGVKVISHTSVMQYKGTRKSLPVVARELGVDGIIEGTILLSGNRVRMTVQLINAASDTHLWAETYERDIRDVIALQDELAEAVARQIKATLRLPEAKQLARKRSIDPKAYQLYLKGRYYFDTLQVEKAAGTFAEAIRIAPDYAEAYAGLAESYDRFGMQNTESGEKSIPKAKDAARRALEIDDSVAAAHASLGWAMMFYDWDWSGAESEFRRAIELNPNYEDAHLWYGCELVWLKRFDEGLAEMRRAQEVSPGSSVMAGFFAMGLYQARQYQKATQQSQDALELDRTFAPARLWLGLTYLADGRKQEGVAELETAVHFAKEHQLRISAALSRLGYGYGLAERRKDALAVLNELQSISVTKYVPAIHFAIVYIGLGDKDSAFAWLEKAYVERSYELALINVDPRFDSLRSDPRFITLIKRMKFPE